MDLVTKYRNETNKDAFTDSYYLENIDDGDYKNEYVRWLEEQVKNLNIQLVSNSKTADKGCHTCGHNPNDPSMPEICKKCNRNFSNWQPLTDC